MRFADIRGVGMETFRLFFGYEDDHERGNRDSRESFITMSIPILVLPNTVITFQGIEMPGNQPPIARTKRPLRIVGCKNDNGFVDRLINQQVTCPC